MAKLGLAIAQDGVCLPLNDKISILMRYIQSDGRDEGTVWNPPLGINPDTKTRSYSAVVRRFPYIRISQETELGIQEYYTPNAGRRNLYVLTGAQVTKVELSSKPDKQGNLRATGVTYVSGGKKYTADVKKDVIVSGGGVQSPQMLELSGIGNKELLQKVGIQSKIDLPGVGENYQDHLVYLESFTVPNSIETWDVIQDPKKNATVFKE